MKSIQSERIVVPGTTRVILCIDRARIVSMGLGRSGSRESGREYRMGGIIG